MYSGKASAELIEEALQSANAFDRNSAMQELEWRRREEIDKLIKRVKDKDAPPLSRYFAVRLLGLYRDRRAIPILVENLDWKYKGDVAIGAISVFNSYPCAAALAQFYTECAGPVLGEFVGLRKDSISDEMLILRVHLLETAYPNRVEPWGTDDAMSVVERYMDRMAPEGTDARANMVRLLEKLKERRR